MQELDSLMSNYSPLTLEDMLGNNNNLQQPTTFNSPDGRVGNNDFTDLLSEFTLTTGNVLSPETLGKSPEVSSGGSGSGFENEDYNVDGRVVNSNNSSKSPEELMDSLGVSPMESSEGYEFVRSGHQDQDSIDRTRRAKQLADAISNMDSATQAQLLNALLPGGNSGSDKTSPMDQSPVPQPQQAHSPYDHRPSQASSRHASPGGFRSFKPLPLAQQLPNNQDYFDAVSLAHSTALNTSLPPSIVPSPHASPFMHPTYYPHPPSHLQLQHPQLQQHQGHSPQPFQLPQQFQHQAQPSPQSFNILPPSSFQNAFSPQTFARSTSSDLQAQLALEALNLGFSPNNAQIQNGISQVQREVGGTNSGSNTGGSYATTAATEDWGENDFIFSPLMSPALTAHSVFSAASSLPPSASCLPPPHILQSVNPTDFFSPLGSPAILPQNFQLPVLPGSSNYPTTYPQSQTQSQPHSRSQSLSVAHGQTMSPQLLATDIGGDAGMSTAAGSGRRGAGANKKSRPSPLLKPTPDANLRRKKLPNEKRSSSSSGMRSVTTSPFLGPSTISMTSSNSIHSGSSVPSSSRTSPHEVGESDNTPSPVDLAVSEVLSTSNQIPLQQQQQQNLQQSPYSMASTSYLPEFMGPPPPPSSNPPSRRSSMNPTNSNLNPSEGAWNPVTPATLMNFASDLAGAGLSNLTYPHHLQHHQDQQQLQQQQQQLAHSLSQELNSNYQYTPNDIQLDDSVENIIVDPTMTKAKAKKAAAAAAKVGTNGNTINGGAKGKGKAAVVKNIKVSAGTKSKSNGDGRKNSLEVQDGGPHSNSGADIRRTSHKAAEQKRRDSLKQCFEELRKILPPMTNVVDPDDRRPGEGNVGGQRGGSVDPENPNRGVSKVALLRRSNDFISTLGDRIDRRDIAIDQLRNLVSDLMVRFGEDEGDLMVEYDDLDKDEQAPKTMEFYENLDSEDEELEYKPKPRKGAAARRKSDAEAKGKPSNNGIGAGSRRSSRNTGYGDEDTSMDVERD